MYKSFDQIAQETASGIRPYLEAMLPPGSQIQLIPDHSYPGIDAPGLVVAVRCPAAGWRHYALDVEAGDLTDHLHVLQRWVESSVLRDNRSPSATESAE
jgi:hypothetical protein